MTLTSTLPKKNHAIPAQALAYLSLTNAPKLIFILEHSQGRLVPVSV